ncbi:MAG TPA: glycosyltransferase family 4 protein [Peptococcaceae bacterium]|nr:glycosyltransferase family 4 protein [Peptococcaceae bacterium]
MDLNPSCMLHIRQNRSELAKYLPFSKTKFEVLKWQDVFQKKAYENCRGLFTMSQWVKDIVVNNTGISADKVHVVGGGINLDVSQITKEKKENNKILFVGKDFYRKGGDLVVKAFQRLKKEMPEAELYIAGPTEKPREIDTAPEGIYFLGLLSYDEVAKYFNMCDIFCMPSRFEAFGLVVIEALVYGLPCIVNNDFAMREIICDGENGYVLYDDDLDSLKDKMKMLLHNDKIKENVLRNRDKYLKDYSWDTVAEKILQAIESGK